MPNTVTLEHAKAHLEDLVAGAERNEEWLIVGSSGTPIAKLAAHPMEPGVMAASNTGHASLLGLVAGQIQFQPGWDDPLPEFEPYT